MTEQSADTILQLLKSGGPQTAKGLAQALGMTPEGARQHLAKLADDGLVSHSDAREVVGRPKRYWRLTGAGHGRFPDRHALLTLELLDAVRDEFGTPGLERLIAIRERQMLARYTSRIGDEADLGGRIRALAEARSEEGYMAEWREDGDGGFTLIEHHCPICAAATECRNFCRSELEVFQQVLGPGATVERTEHLLAGARRCAYRITPNSL